MGFAHLHADESSAMLSCALQDDERVVNFLFNSPAVREAFHAAPVANASQTLAGFYRGCSPAEDLNYSITVPSVYPYHKSNIARGLRVLVYSGDVDTAVPSVGSQLWTAELGNELGVVAEWAPWYMLEPEAYGYQVSVMHMHASTRGQHCSSHACLALRRDLP